ncbi:uncharacterized protein LOC135935823 [Cloeon dipterum]|uniref:uncharacterized protein LOC135935823 n=1 Tax=Cloeon dipterum TaxID=197152 RepID=UPI00321F8A03
MQLPDKFFFRLDCHQAAIAFGVFDLIILFPLLCYTKAAQIVMENNANVTAKIIEIFGESATKEVSNGMFGAVASALFHSVIVIFMLIAVFKQGKLTRWLMLPWLIYIPIALLGIIALAINSAIVFYTLGGAPAALLTAIAGLFSILYLCYSILAVFCSFRSLGSPSYETSNLPLKQGDAVVVI